MMRCSPPSRQGRSGPFQAHGAETPERIGDIARLTGKPVIKAIRVKDDADIAAAAAYSAVATLILYDAKAPETLGNALPGGNGHAFDWGLLEGNRRPAFMLAGGLTPENVAQAIRVTGAPVVDVSSGVEIGARRQGHRPHPEIH